MYKEKKGWYVDEGEYFPSENELNQEGMAQLYSQRAIYKDPRLTTEMMVQVLEELGNLSFDRTRIYDSLHAANDATAGYFIPVEEVVLYEKALRAAAQFYARSVLLPQGEITEVEIDYCVEDYVRYGLKHEGDHQSKMPSDAAKRGIEQYYKIGFCTAVSIVDEDEDLYGVRVDNQIIASFVYATQKDNPFKLEEHLAVAMGPGEEHMSPGDKRMVELLNQKLIE